MTASDYFRKYTRVGEFRRGETVFEVYSYFGGFDELGRAHPNFSVFGPAVPVQVEPSTRSSTPGYWDLSVDGIQWGNHLLFESKEKAEEAASKLGFGPGIYRFGYTLRDIAGGGYCSGVVCWEEKKYFSRYLPPDCGKLTADELTYIESLRVRIKAEIEVEAPEPMPWVQITEDMKLTLPET